MISFLSSTMARLIGAGLLALAVLGGVYAKGWADRNKAFTAYKAEVAAAAKLQEERIAAEVSNRIKITKKAELNHAKSSTIISSTYAALRMRSPASGSQVSAVPDPATKPDAAAAHYVSIAPDLAERCAQTTQQLADLQEWVSDQHGVE